MATFRNLTGYTMPVTFRTSDSGPMQESIVGPYGSQSFQTPGTAYYEIYCVEPNMMDPNHRRLALTGYFRSQAQVDINPWNGRATISPSRLSQTALDSFKQHMLNESNQAGITPDAKLQSLTLAELVEYGQAQGHSGQDATLSPNQRQTRGIATPCNIAKAVVLIDCFLTVWGAVGLRAKLSPAAIEDVAVALEHADLPHLEQYIQTIGDSASTFIQKGNAIVQIGLLIKNGGMLEAIYHAVIKDLSWWDMVLYGVLAMTEVAAAFLTDFALLAAEIAVELATIAFLVTDSFKAYETCHG